jgi:hypothetical protein
VEVGIRIAASDMADFPLTLSAFDRWQIIFHAPVYVFLQCNAMTDYAAWRLIHPPRPAQFMWRIHPPSTNAVNAEVGIRIAASDMADGLLFVVCI